MTATKEIKGFYRDMNSIYNKKANQDTFLTDDSIRMIYDDELFYNKIIRLCETIRQTNFNDDTKGTLFELREEDPFTYTHQQQVALMATLMGTYSNYPTLPTVYKSGLLHDMGKKDLQKLVYHEGKLSEKQKEEMDTHPHLGKVILEELGERKIIRCVAADHHEKLDGTGYARQKEADELEDETKMITIADCFSAMRYPRHFRSLSTKLNTTFALYEIKKGSDQGAYDKAFYEVLRKIVSESFIRLNSN